MSTTPENLNNPNAIENSVPKKSGGLGFKFALALLVILAGTGAAGYLAYERGMANQYLPEVLQKKLPAGVTLNPVETPNNNTADTNAANAPNTANPPTTPSTATAENTTAATSGSGNTAASASNTPSTANADTNGTTATTATPAGSSASPATTPPSVAAAPATQAAAPQPLISNAVTAALMTTLDAQNQWQSLQFDFNQNWDTAHALQQIQMLKNQLQAANNSALLPSISALTQVEGQIQAWNGLNPKANLAALQQSVTDIGKLHIRTTQEQQENEAQAASGLWNRFVATLKQIFAVKRVNTNEVQMLDNANAAIVKQGINANLMYALWLAHNGQWGAAQEQLRMANGTVQQYGQGYTLDALKPMMENASWPSAPDFSIVQQALTQARSQLAAQMQSEAGSRSSTPAATPSPALPSATTPATPAATPNNPTSNKGVSL